MSGRRLPASQRRNFHRLEILLPVSFKLLSEQAARGNHSRPDLGSSINLSLGGLLLGSGREIPAKSRVFCTFKLWPQEAEIWIEAIALDSQAQPEGAIFKWLTHLRFDHLPKEVEQALGRFMAQKQKELRRRP
jgi:c-di-GMP-binding flagellar brake protein YcgR